MAKAATPATKGTSDAQDVSETVADAVPAKPDAPPRKRGRPRGSGKVPGSGKKKGQANWTNEMLRTALLERSEAVSTLADICAGRQILTSGPTGKSAWVYPSMSERLRALELVMKKVLPDLSATELSGPDKSSLFKDDTPPDHRQAARAILVALGAGIEGGDASPFPLPRLAECAVDGTFDATEPANEPNGDGSSPTASPGEAASGGAVTSPPFENGIEEPNEPGSVEPGSVEEVEGGVAIMFEGDRWHVHGVDGQRVAGASDRAAALRMASELAESGSISR